MTNRVAVADRPREKLQKSGASALGGNELLAILIGHGTTEMSALALADRVLAAAGSLQGLTRIHRDQLLRLPGIGPVQASRILAAVEIGRRTLLVDTGERPQFLSSREMARFLLPQYGAYPVERFGVVLLDTRYRLIATRVISVGSLDSSSAHPREVFREAVLAGAAAVVAFHNHPSGDPTPSRDDLALTQRLVDAGSVVGVDLVDHMILADTQDLLDPATEASRMTRVMYLDCFSGAAGDMLLGAFLDAGLPLDALRDALGSLGADHDLRITRVLRSGLSATRVEVVEKAAPAAGSSDAPGAHPRAVAHQHDHGDSGGHGHSHEHPDEDLDGQSHRTLAEIAHLIGHSSLSAAAKTRAVQLFRRLAEAEAAIHHMALEDVHLHEVGALDSIIDIVGVVFAMEWFGVDEVMASPLNVGGGTIQIAHGTFPVPAPATARLLQGQGAPIYSAGPQVELVTPTGALLVTAYAHSYGPVPRMVVDQVGYGAGTRDFAQRPNVLRVLIGSRATAAPGQSPVQDVEQDAPSRRESWSDARRDAGAGSDTERFESIVKIECEIDDMNPQLFGPATAALFAIGALDVFLTAVQMKKGRPGTLVTVLAPEALRARICDTLFRETTTIGVRFERMWREILDRHSVDVMVPGGSVRIKISGRAGERLNAAPEFDDCVRIAHETGRSVRAVQAEALRAWNGQQSDDRVKAPADPAHRPTS